MSSSYKWIFILLLGWGTASCNQSADEITDDDNDNDDLDTEQDDDDDSGDDDSGDDDDDDNDDDNDDASDDDDDDDDNDNDDDSNCGNGVIDGTEACDGEDLGGNSCTDLGFTGGTLACAENCEYDTSACCEPPPDPGQDWLQDYEKEVLAALTGEAEIAPGEIIEQRYTPEQRDLARTFMLEMLEAEGLETAVHEYDSGGNPYAVLASNMPDHPNAQEWVIIGGHMDSVKAGPGSVDNGTGITLVMAVARYAASITCRSRNLMFAGFDEEELGGVGSRAMAPWVKEQGYDVHSMHNIDMVGWDDDGDNKIWISKASDEMFQLYQDVVAASDYDFPLEVESFSASDHSMFANEGFNSLLISEQWGTDSTPYEHSADDTFTNTHFDYLENATILVSLMVAELTRID